MSFPIDEDERSRVERNHTVAEAYLDHLRQQLAAKYPGEPISEIFGVPTLGDIAACFTNKRTIEPAIRLRDEPEARAS